MKGGKKLQRAIAKEDLCEKIRAGTEVEVIPEYSYLFDQRIKEVFNLKSGEVVVRKINENNEKEEALFEICKTERKKLIFKK